MNKWTIASGLALLALTVRMLPDPSTTERRPWNNLPMPIKAAAIVVAPFYGIGRAVDYAAERIYESVMRVGSVVATAIFEISFAVLIVFEKIGMGVYNIFMAILLELQPILEGCRSLFHAAWVRIGLPTWMFIVRTAQFTWAGIITLTHTMRTIIEQSISAAANMVNF